MSYWSKALSRTEREYSATEVECKALHDALLRYDVYLKCCTKLKCVTDHNALTYLVATGNQLNNGRLMRYLMDIMDFNFELVYKEGKKHLDADAVSRLLRHGHELEFLTADDL